MKCKWTNSAVFEMSLSLFLSWIFLNCFKSPMISKPIFFKEKVHLNKINNLMPENIQNLTSGRNSCITIRFDWNSIFFPSNFRERDPFVNRALKLKWAWNYPINECRFRRAFLDENYIISITISLQLQLTSSNPTLFYCMKLEYIISISIPSIALQI